MRKMRAIEKKSHMNSFEELLRKLQKRGIHLCHVKNGTIQESGGRHTLEEIEGEGGMNIISIAPENLGSFLKLFLEKKKERGETGGHISFKTENNKITIYGGPRTKEIIKGVPDLQTMSLLSENIQIVTEGTQVSIESAL